MRKPRGQLGSVWLLLVVLLSGTTAQTIREVFPAEGSIFTSSSSSAVVTVTLGTELIPGRWDAHYEIAYQRRAIGSPTFTPEYSLALEQQNAFGLGNSGVELYAEALQVRLGAATAAGLEYRWRLTIHKCVGRGSFFGFLRCWDEYEPWRTFQVIARSDVPSSLVPVTIRATSSSSNTVVFALHQGSQQGEIPLPGTSDRVAFGVLVPGLTYRLTHFDSANDNTVIIQVGDSVFYEGVLQRHLDLVIPATNDGEDPCPLDTTTYNICIDVEPSVHMTAHTLAALARAQARWERVLPGDITDWSVDPELVAEVVDREYAGPRLAQSQLSVLDDLYIYAYAVPYLDGVGGILATARVVLGEWKSENDVLSKMGTLEMDAEDLSTVNQLESILLHEMGHVLGIGSLWELNQLYVDGVYLGTNANREYQNVRFSAGEATTMEPVPIEQDGGMGTAGLHWDEACLRHELMSGYLSGTRQPLSRITLGGLEDLGLEVDYEEADVYTRADLDVSSCPPLPETDENNLRRQRQLQPNHGKKVQQPRRRLDATLKQKAIDYGLDKLRKSKQTQQKRASKLPDLMIDLGSRMIGVIVQDSETGEIFMVPVVNADKMETGP